MRRSRLRPRSAASSSRRWCSWRSRPTGRRARDGACRSARTRRSRSASSRSSGRRVRPVLLVFLTAFSIVDDILAVGVIAVFYTDAISVGALAAALALLAALVVANLAGWHRWPIYAVLGGAVWVAIFKSGVHATTAGRARRAGRAGPVVDQPERVPGAGPPAARRLRGRVLRRAQHPDQRAAAAGHARARPARPAGRDADDLLPEPAHAAGRVRHPARVRVRQRRHAAHERARRGRAESGRLGRGGGPGPRQADRHRALLLDRRRDSASRACRRPSPGATSAAWRAWAASASPSRSSSPSWRSAKARSRMRRASGSSAGRWLPARLAISS